MGVLAACKSVQHMRALPSGKKKVRDPTAGSELPSVCTAQVGSSENAASGPNCGAITRDLLCSLRQDLR